jgi:hypothetical protein
MVWYIWYFDTELLHELELEELVTDRVRQLVRLEGQAVVSGEEVDAQNRQTVKK